MFIDLPFEHFGGDPEGHYVFKHMNNAQGRESIKFLH